MASFKQTKQSSSVSIPWSGMIKCIIFVLLIFLFLGGLNKIKNPNNFPINKVKIFGAAHENHDSLQRLLQPLVNTNFFLIDVSLIKDRLTQLPWIAQVSVKRHWPSEIDIVLQEQQPIARWNMTSLLNASAEAFNPPENNFPTDLPLLFGPEGQQVLIVQYWLAMNKILMPLHFKIARLELTPSLLWLITLDNGVQLIASYNDVLTQLTQFTSVYNKIFANRTSDLAYVDLRYANGLAARWKSITYKEKKPV